MAETDFDAIVVGSGCAGAVAAYELAKAGKSTLVVERGNFAGAKNMTGGRIYSHSLKKVFPDFESEAPLERKITHERIALMDPASQTAVDFTSPELAEEGKDSYSVLRAPFDQWLASKAEDAGAEYICGIAVEELLKDESGRVVGVRAGEDEITAEATIVAEGVNSLLCERSLGNPRPKPSQMAVGIKQVFELPAQTIEDPLPGAGGRGRGYAVRGRLHARKRRRRLPVHQQGLDQPGPRGHHLAGRRRRERDAGVPDARGLQGPPGGRADHPRREAGRALGPHGARGRLRHDPEVRVRRLPGGRRVGGAVHEHGLPGARHGLRRGLGARWRARRPCARSTRATRARRGSPPTRT